MSIVANNRLGRFNIPLEAIEDGAELVQGVLATTLIVRAECLFSQRHIAYEAYSEHFEELAEGNLAPLYDMNVDTEAGTIEWTKIEG